MHAQEIGGGGRDLQSLLVDSAVTWLGVVRHRSENIRKEGQDLPTTVPPMQGGSSNVDFQIVIYRCAANFLTQKVGKNAW